METKTDYSSRKNDKTRTLVNQYCYTDLTALESKVLDPIEILLGLTGESREWRYLNKGTHEESDRAEFDRQTVEQILTSLESLDTAFS